MIPLADERQYVPVLWMWNGGQRPSPGTFTGRRGRLRVFGGGQYLASSLNILPGSAEWQAGRVYLHLGARRTTRPEARRRVAAPGHGRPVALASLDPVTAAVRRTPGAAPGRRIRSRRIIGGKTYRAGWIPAPRADGSGWVAAGRHTETARWTLVAAPTHPPVCVSLPRRSIV
jgi:hypothetical protein